MARPIKNSCDYFSHDADMRNHRKIKAIRSSFGINGYAIWSMTLEYLTSIDGNMFEYSDMEFELMSGDFGVSVAEIRSVIDYCIKLKLLFNRDGWIVSDALNERLAPVYAKRGKAKELSKKQPRVNGKFATETPDGSVVSVAETPQSKVKESKGKDIYTFGDGKISVTIAKKYLNEKVTNISDLALFLKARDKILAFEEKGWVHYDAFLNANAGREFNDADHLYNAFRNFCIGYRAPPQMDKFEAARYNRTLWTDEAWKKHYSHLLNDPEFKKAFNL